MLRCFHRGHRSHFTLGLRCTLSRLVLVVTVCTPALVAALFGRINAVACTVRRLAPAVALASEDHACLSWSTLRVPRDSLFHAHRGCDRVGRQALQLRHHE